MHTDVNIIANACRQRRKTHSRSSRLYSRSHPPLRHRSEHFRDWLASLGVDVYPISNWTPPEQLFYYKVKVFSPKTKAMPKIGNALEIRLIPAMFVPQIGRSTYISDSKGHLRLTIRPNTIREVRAMDGGIWYDITAAVTVLNEQKIVIPEAYRGCLDYVPAVDDYLRLIYSPNERTSALLSHSRGALGCTIKAFFPPYLHFDTCIECRNKMHQIGYIVSDGPRFDTIDHLEQNPDAITKQPFNYLIDKVICAKDDHQLTTVTRKSFRLKIKILSIQAEKSIIPDYGMVVGQVLDCSPVNLRSDEPTFLARDNAESDASLFLPGTYVYIDHYTNRKEQPPQTKSTSPYQAGSEIAQICYIIGPGTHEFGACPIHPFS